MHVVSNWKMVCVRLQNAAACVRRQSDDRPTVSSRFAGKAAVVTHRRVFNKRPHTHLLDTAAIRRLTALTHTRMKERTRTRCSRRSAEHVLLPCIFLRPSSPLVSPSLPPSSLPRLPLNPVNGSRKDPFCSGRAAMALAACLQHRRISCYSLKIP